MNIPDHRMWTVFRIENIQIQLSILLTKSLFNKFSSVFWTPLTSLYYEYYRLYNKVYFPSVHIQCSNGDIVITIDI